MIPLLEVKNLTKKFGNFKALNNISFQLNKGEVVGLIGGNGSGKTTLSEIIVGINKPTSGKINYNFEYKTTFKEKVGMQFQDSIYPSGLTVKDIVLFAKNLHHIDISQKQLLVLLKKFQMRDFYKRKVKFLSGGQRQKLNILLSVLHKPKIIVLDELTTGLDISAREDIVNFTKNLLKTQNVSAIIISHNMHEIKALCENIIILSKGQIITQSSIEQIEKKHKSLDEYMKNLIYSESNSTDYSQNIKKSLLAMKKKKKKGK